MNKKMHCVIIIATQEKTKENIIILRIDNYTTKKKVRICSLDFSPTKV